MIKSKMKAQAAARTEAILSGEPLSDLVAKANDKEEEKLPAKELIPPSGKPSRNLFISTSSSQEKVKTKSESQHPTPRMMLILADNIEEPTKSEPLQIDQVFYQHEQRVEILQKDRELYDNQYKKLSQKVTVLKSQLSEALQEVGKCNKTFYIR